MKAFSAEALAALDSGDVIVSGAVRIGSATPLCIWGGEGSLTLDAGFGLEAYRGVADRGLVSVSGGALGGVEAGAELRLSGVDPDVAGQLNLETARGEPVVLWRLIFNGTGARLLQASVYMRGSVDRAPVEETPGGTSTITVGVEGAARGLGRRSERMHSDADQRLISPSDSGFKRIAYAGEKQIFWGGKPPQTAKTALKAESFSLGGLLRIIGSQR